MSMPYQVSDGDVEAEIVRRLRGHRSVEAEGFTAVHVTDDPADLPDTDGVQLAVLHPRRRHDPYAADGSPALAAAREILERCGHAARVHRNAMVVLAADATRHQALAGVVLTFLEDGGQNQRLDALVTAHLLETWCWLLIPEQAGESAPLSIRVTDLDRPTPGRPGRDGDGAADLAAPAARALRDAGALLGQHDARAIRRDLDGPLTTAWRSGHLEVGELWQYYTSRPYLPRLRDRSVLDAGLRDTVQEDLDWQYSGFALADGYDEATDSYLGLRLPGNDPAPRPIVASTLVVRPDRSVEQYHALLAEQAMVSDEAGRPRPLVPLVPLVPEQSAGSRSAYESEVAARRLDR